MSTEYSPDKQLIEDFIRYISERHKAAIVEFPDEYAAHQYVNYRFVNTCEIVEEFIERRKIKKDAFEQRIQSIEAQLKEIRKELEESLALYKTPFLKAPTKPVKPTIPLVLNERVINFEECKP